MNVGGALKLTCVGMAGGVILRLANMLFFYDYDTGFYTDKGLMAWLIILFLAAIAVISQIWCRKDKSSFAIDYKMKKDFFAGITSVLCAVSLIVMAVVQWNSHQSYLGQGQVNRSFAQTSSIHLIFIVCSLLFAILQLANAYGLFTGNHPFKNFPVVQLMSVIWGGVSLLFTFIFYAKSALTVENIYMIFGDVSLVFSLLYISKIIVGMGGESVARRCFLVGIPAILINVTYSMSNLVLYLLGRNYFRVGEIPMAMQLTSLCISCYVLAFLFSYGQYDPKLDKDADVDNDGAEQERDFAPKTRSSGSRSAKRYRVD